MTVYSEIDFFLKSFSNDMILLDSSMTAKIPDFGFSVELPKLSHGKTLFTTTCIAGTTHLTSVQGDLVIKVTYTAME